MKAFTVSESGNFEGRNVLQRQGSGPLNETVETALQKLFKHRYGTLPAETIIICTGGRCAGGQGK